MVGLEFQEPGGRKIFIDLFTSSIGNLAKVKLFRVLRRVHTDTLETGCFDAGVSLTMSMSYPSPL
jgi:hypothetical protein